MMATSSLRATVLTCVLGGLIGGCTVDAPQQPVVAAVPSEVAGESTPSTDAKDAFGARDAGSLATEGADGPEGGPVIFFKPDGLSPTYKNYTGDPAAIHQLRANLKGWVRGDTLVLKVHWDERLKHGTFTLHLPEADERWDPVSEAVKGGGIVDLATIQPVLAALGAYREELGARFDLRLLAFDIRLSWWDKRSGSHCTLSGVANDPEGSDPARCFKCVDFRAGIHDICRAGDAWPSPVAGPKKGIRMLSSALQSTPP